MKERSELIEWLRGEMVGPGRHLKDQSLASFLNKDFSDPIAKRSGPLM